MCKRTDGGTERTCQPKVRQLQLPVSADEEILGLKVAAPNTSGEGRAQTHVQQVDGHS